MKMMGSQWPSARRRLCSSIPLMPGICTSEIRQAVSSRRPDSRNSSAEAKLTTACPSELTKRAVARRNDVSSSMTEITDECVKAAPSLSPPLMDTAPVKSYKHLDGWLHNLLRQET